MSGLKQEEKIVYVGIKTNNKRLFMLDLKQAECESSNAKVAEQRSFIQELKQV